MKISEFAEALSAGHLTVGRYDLEIAGAAAPLEVSVLMLAPGHTTIAYAFHGSVDQSKRDLPVFFGARFVARFPDRMTLISIADPGLRLSKTALYTWYAGDAAQPTPDILRALFTSIAEQVKPAHTLFLAGSSGARPALMHSLEVRGSLCLCVNPLTSIAAFPANLDRYAKLCWPDLTNEEVREWLGDEVAALYAGGYPNRVIVLQNCTDINLRRQTLPLIASLATQPDFLFLSEFFLSHIGHIYPVEPMDNWLGAILSDPSAKLKDIASLATRTRSIAISNSSGPSKKPFDPAQLDVADRVALDLIGRH